MNVRISAGATEEEASAIAAALARHVDGEVEVYVGNAEEPTAVRDAVVREPEEDDLGPTEREERLWEEIADIEEGGPEK
jgi:methylmalonyl-CoA decarboxylase subunit alpha